jgi:hypothetical protein
VDTALAPNQVWVKGDEGRTEKASELNLAPGVPASHRSIALAGDHAKLGRTSRRTLYEMASNDNNDLAWTQENVASEEMKSHDDNSIM